MIKLNENELAALLKSGERFELVHEGKTYELRCEMYVSFGEESSEISYGDYELSLDEETLLSVSSLKEINAFFQTEELPVARINGFSSMEDFYAERAFQNATMEELLEKYADCDTFSLCGYFDEVHLSEAAAGAAIEELKNVQKAYLFDLYDKYGAGRNLPPFEELYAEIEKECLRFEKKQVKRRFFRKYSQCSMICDEVGKKTKYAEPHELFWHFYHTVGFLLDSRREVERLHAIYKRVSPVAVLEKEEYVRLKPALRRCKITFQTHCTTSGNLQKELFFSLNEQTRAWLLQRKNDYDFQGELQDLAFYQGTTLRFSSCTHEGFHNDVPVEVHHE